MNMLDGAIVQDKTLPAGNAAVDVPLRIEERRVAWLGTSILLRGDLISLEDMSIDGRVEGNIELRDHTLTVGADANIQGDITAKVVTILGTVIGTIVAAEAVHIRETGSVEGNITAPRLAMADGAVVNGQINIGPNRAATDPMSASQLNAVPSRVV
jgi:cytoskeletal protein CcmA (bactofilin family)